MSNGQVRPADTEIRPKNCNFELHYLHIQEFFIKNHTQVNKKQSG